MTLVFAGFERGGSDARHGRRASVKFAQSKTQTTEPVPQGRLSERRSPPRPRPYPPAHPRSISEPASLPANTRPSHCSSHGPNGQHKAGSFAVTSRAHSTDVAQAQGFFSPQTPVAVSFCRSRSAHAHTVQHGAFYVPILFKILNFCIRDSAWPGRWLIAKKKKLVCKLKTGQVPVYLIPSRKIQRTTTPNI